MKKLLLFTASFLCLFTAHAQIVNIPDAAFKAKLLDNGVIIDTNGDGEIQVSGCCLQLRLGCKWC